MGIESISGVITWIPELSGSYDVTVRASNGELPDDTQSFVIEVLGNAPVITSTPVTTVTVGDIYSYDVEAAGSPEPAFFLDTAPEGMSIESVTGVINWTPELSGTYDVTVRASNGELPDAIQSFSIEASGTAPAITSTPVTSAELGNTYEYDVNATGDPQQTFSLEVAPDGMVINPNFGLITWTPDALGEYEVTVVASNGVEPDAKQSFTITVLGFAPEITSNPVITISLGETYNYNVIATGIPDPEFSLTEAPSGMGINEVTGVISWTPSTVGSFAVTVSVINGISPDATQSFTVSVIGTAPAFVSTPVTSGIVDETYIYNVNATGIPNPTYALTTAPAGMTIDAVSGLITWTPTEAGIYSVAVSASNGVGQTTIQSYSLTIAAEGIAALITSIPINTVLVNESYTYDVNATGNPVPRYTLVNAPDGMSIDPLSGLIFWTPTAEGEFIVTVSASNGVPPGAVQSFILVVTESSFAPSITSVPITNAVMTDHYSYNVEAVGNPEPIYSLRSGPTGMRIDPVSGEIMWTPPALGNYEVTIEASNGVDPGALQSYTLTVTDDDFAPEFRSVPVTIAVLNGFYTYDVETTGNPAPTYFLGVAPDGMNIEPLSGLITWRPEVTGAFEVQVLASNGAGLDVIQAFTITVTEADFAPIITSSSVTLTAVNQPYAYTLEATGNPTPSYLVDGPPGMHVNPVSGRVTWTPSAAGEYEVTVTATNGVNPDATQPFTLVVSADRFAPMITSRQVTLANVSDPYTYEVIATGNPAPVFSLDSAPNSMTIDDSTGVISWVPSVEGTVEVTVIATNGVLPDAAQSFMIAVGPVPTFVEEEAEVTELGLMQNYPNPFNFTTTIEYSLPNPDHVYIEVFDILGRQVRMLEDSYRAEGRHRIVWNGQDAREGNLPAGLYFVRIQTGTGESRVVTVTKLN